MINYQFKINMQGERERYENLVFTTGDKNGYRLEFVFYSNGKRFDTSLYGLTVKAKRADGVLIIDSGITTGEGAYYDVADNAYGIKGELEFEVALVKADGSYATTQVISAQVREGFGESGLSSEDNEPVLAKLEGQYLECRAAEDANSKLIAENTKQITVNAGTIKTNTYRIANLESNVVMPAITAYDEINCYEERVPTGTIVTYSSVFKAKGLLFGGESETDIAICRMTDLIDTTIPTATETVVVTRGDNISIWERNLGITERTDSDGNNYYIVIDSSEEFVLISETDLSSAINTNAEAIAENAENISDNKQAIEANQTAIEANKTAISENATKIQEVDSELQEVRVEWIPDLDAQVQGNKASIEIIQADMYNDKKEARSIFANAIKGTASGEAIRIDDISPVEHNLAVKVSSETIEDISAVKVKALGKNFIDIPNYINYTYSPDEANIQGTTITIEKSQDGNTPSIVWELGDYADFVGKTLTVSCDVNDIGGADTNAAFMIAVTYKNPFKESGTVTVNALSIVKSYIGTRVSRTFTVPEQADYVEGKPLAIRLYLNQGTTIGDYLKVSNLQVEAGDTATDYEPYKESAEYEVSADGTVSGVTSIYPNMTLLANTNGVVIDAEYNRDTNKAIRELANAIIALGGTI